MFCKFPIPTFKGSRVARNRETCISKFEMSGSNLQEFQDVTMDPKLWSNTPPVIQELVFARLPLESLIQLRLLSKHWHSYLTSPAFQVSFDDGRPKSFAVVESERPDPKRVWAYDARVRRWLGLPLAYLPFSFLVGADGGLLCFVKYTKLEERLQVVVCNPLTCTWRELPPAFGVQMIPKSVHLKVNMKSKHYTIKFFGSQNVNEPEVLHVYSSVTNSWGRLDWSRQDDLVGRLILINLFLGSIHTYDINTGAGSIRYPPDFDLDVVAQVEGCFLFQADNACIFLLKTVEGKCSGERDQKGEKKWDHLSHIPKAELLQNYFFSMFLCGEAILLLGKKRKLFYDASHEIGDDLDLTDNNNLMLMLDMSTKTWTEVTDHNIEPDCLSRYIIELRLDAVP